jgi:protein-L-isoaspartate(D-aspartate) O-methyltransferase
MLQFNLQAAREQMIEQQIRAWEVFDQRVLDLLDEMPRERFVPERYRNLAFADTAIPLGHGQVMMAPKIEGRMLQALNPGPQDSVLEVGTGSGFMAACLARLGERVLSVEILAEFTKSAKARLAELGFANVEVETRDASRLDWLSERFDVIAVTGSLPMLDNTFQERLNIGGRLFVIVGEPPVMEALLLTRVDENQWTRESLFETALTPLINAARPNKFKF